MKKIVALIFSCLFFVCSCSAEPATYKNQENVNMNYNNITNCTHFWLTTDSICYSKDILSLNWFLTDKYSTEKIDEIVSCNHVQIYGEKIYLLDSVSFVDERNSKYELKAYDVDFKKTEKVCSLENCENFLLLDEVVYYSENTWTDDIPELTLKKFSINSNKHAVIGSGVVSFGVIDDSLCYVVKDNNRMVIFKYNAENGTSVNCGEFSSEEIQMPDDDYFFLNNLKVSYTPDYLYFTWIDYENETSTILSYSFEQNTLKNRKIEGYIDGFASYDANSYFIVSSEKTGNSELYMLKNKTDEITEITEIQGEGSLFVGSDEGVYVLKHKDNNLVFYSNGGIARIVYEF